jgi:hypothetical protein
MFSNCKAKIQMVPLYVHTPLHYLVQIHLGYLCLEVKCENLEFQSLLCLIDMIVSINL